MKKILFKSTSAFLAFICFINFTFNGLVLARADVESSSIAAGAGVIAPAASINYSLGSFQTDLFRGNASFSVPINVPQGRRGIAPQLALSYSSQPINGWCGVGWNLSLGEIERSMKNGYPAYDSTDTFAYNGSELVSVGSGEYRLKTDGAFMKFTNNGTYWEVIDKAGTVYRFDSTITTTLGVFRWALTRVTDVHGNYMTVTYFTDQNQSYPQQIAYTGNDDTSLSPCYTVDFNLESRTDDIIQHLILPIINTSGSPTVAKSVTAYRLNTIDVKYNGSLVRKYDLDYKYSGYTSRSLLEDITLYGSDGTTALNPISFQYNETLPQIQSDTDVDLSTCGGAPLMGDFNGDGINDICMALYEDFHVYWGAADGSFSDGGVVGHFAGSDAGDSHLATGDFNGDGYTDIFNLLTWGCGNNYTYLVYISDANSFATGASWYYDTRIPLEPRQDGGVIGRNPYVFVNDVNKDGKSDVFILDNVVGMEEYYQGANFIGNYYISKQGQDGFESSNLGCKLATLSTPRYMHFSTGDFDNDGCMDFVFAYESSDPYYPNTIKVSLYPAYLSPEVIYPDTWKTNCSIYNFISTADVNYDGFTDFIRFYSLDGSWTVFDSIGTAFVENQTTWCSNFGVVYNLLSKFYCSLFKMN